MGDPATSQPFEISNALASMSGVGDFRHEGYAAKAPNPVAKPPDGKIRNLSPNVTESIRRAPLAGLS